MIYILIFLLFVILRKMWNYKKNKQMEINLFRLGIKKEHIARDTMFLKIEPNIGKYEIKDLKKEMIVYK